MRTLKIKSLSLVNFKGVKALELTFNPDTTTICGANGTGKTTVFDAFLWLLFGKDSTGRADSNFNIKTLDNEGNPILHTEHSVEGVFDLDGQTITLKRQYTEVWQKISGTTDQVLKNHATVFYVNGVKQPTKRDYDSVVTDIISEDIFKLITNPYYFANMDAPTKKAKLLDMVGGIMSDEDFASGNDEYTELLRNLQGKNIDQYNKEIAARKKAIKEILAVIPSQIDTAKRLMPADEDWAAVESEIKSKEDAIKTIDGQIADRTKVNEAENARKKAIYDKINAKERERSQRVAALQAQAFQDINQATLAIQGDETALTKRKSLLEQRKRELQSTDQAIARLNGEIEQLRNEYKSLIAQTNAAIDERNSVMLETLTYSEGEFTCPTCKRVLEPDDIERKQAELQANFNQAKAQRLKAIDDKISAINAKKEANIESGKKKATVELPALQQKRAELSDEITALTSEIAETEKAIGQKRASLPKAPDITPIIAADPDCIAIANEIEELNNQLSIEVEHADVESLIEGKSMLQSSLKDLYTTLAKREQIKKAQKEIEELGEQQLSNNQELAALERLEAIALQFQKDKDAELMKRINGLFQVVTFSFVSQQLNGNEKITCICKVDGVPYADVNAAGKLNAGLDIINAICQCKGVSAPIFIDNRESVNNIIPTISQVVNLVVSTDKSLTIK